MRTCESPGVARGDGSGLELTDTLANDVACVPIIRPNLFAYLLGFVEFSTQESGFFSLRAAPPGLTTDADKGGLGSQKTSFVEEQ